jgi:hypothetical protein
MIIITNKINKQYQDVVFLHLPVLFSHVHNTLASLEEWGGGSLRTWVRLKLGFGGRKGSEMHKENQTGL